ncbi:MAG: 50S ribosomal protein L25 [Methylocystaceae bacterium]
MGDMISIHGYLRQQGSRGQMNRLRASGLIPAVCYGHGQEGLAISLPENEAKKRLGRRNGNTLVQLTIEGEETPRLVLLKEIQRNPLDNRMLHIDFQAINLGDTITAEVPIMLHGEGEIVKKGWSISHQLREVTVECLPGNLPSNLILQVDELQLGDKLVAGDLILPEQVKLAMDADAVILVVMPPGRAETPPEAEEVTEG